ncbi:SFI1-like protein [Heterocephalus glaber]|uniref:SFI1-like protein n=1 Tax=Heterocephalus glaber TaxID=10181 RepID=G5BBV2_HETGA|nr:SFI1-like protein [Heterocephalus glaber]
MLPSKALRLLWRLCFLLLYRCRWFYYEQKILQKVFEGWKEEWWVSHREWKLCVRADYHYRYYLYNLVFQSWKACMRWQQEMRSKYMKAKDHDAKQKMRQAWKAWLIYVAVRRTKLQMHTTALEFSQQSILWMWWSKWRQQLGQAHMNHAFCGTALKHRAFSLKLQAWSQWKEQLLLSQRERWKVVLAVQHHQWWQKRKSLRAWLEYLNMHRVKKQQNDVSLCTEEIAQREVGERHQQHSLLLLHRFWNIWQSRIEQRAEKEQLPSLNIAWAHYREVIEKQVFAVWWQKMFQHRENHLAERIRLALQAAEQQKLMQADLHSQRAMLRRALQKWLAYQGWVWSILQEVTVRESQHNRQLIRWALHRWRKNTMAHADEARRSSQARAHYRRTVCSKVLVQWREVASVQIYYRQWEACALREAQKVLERGCLCIWFRCWQDRSQRAAQQKAQLEGAARHHHQHLLREAVAQWKAYHLECVRKKILQRQGSQLLAQRLSQACFHQWRRQLVVKRQEQQSTARALWFWAFSLQAKAWAAWLGFVLDRRRKKVRLEQAVQAYHQQLLQEGATRLLRFTASLKAFRQQLQAQQQVQMSAQPTTPGPKPKVPPILTCGPDPHLLLPEDFTGTRARPDLSSEAASHVDLEVELEGIQQQLQQYQTTRKDLWSCQRQASNLRKWLELSQEDPRAEDQDTERQIQKELEEVELQIQQLAKDLQAQRQPIHSCIARIQALRQVLC